MKKAIIAIVLISLLLLLAGCSEKDDSVPLISQKTNSTASNNHESAGMQFVDCLKSRNVKLYSLKGCNPCHDNVEELFNQLAVNRKFSSMVDFQNSVSSFMSSVYTKCGSNCNLISTPFSEANGVFSVSLNETSTPTSGCIATCTLNGARIGSFPTWAYNNKQIGSGKISLSMLSSKTGCNWR